MKKNFMKLHPKIREILLYFINLTKIKNPLKINSKFKKIVKQDFYEKWGAYEKNKDIWIINYKKLTYKCPDGLMEAEFFFKDEINIIKQKELTKGVILICLVKNDLDRIKEFIKYYKKMGIKNIVIIDNNSNDGTFEFLKKCEDITLFQVKETYTTIRRQSWINRIISYYGFNKWYLILDSDEFLTYNNMDNKNIDDLVSYFETKKIERCRALMIDMYPKSYKLDSNKPLKTNFRDMFSYFDTDTYIEKSNKYFQNIVGGMRKRLFSTKNDVIEPFLVKYPLIFFRKGDVHYNSHYSSPFYKNFNYNLNLGILHYKFLPNDITKIMDIVKKGNFAAGSKEYKSYLNFYRKNSSMCPIYEKTKKFNNSDDIYDIALLQKIEWQVEDKNEI